MRNSWTHGRQGFFLSCTVSHTKRSVRASTKTRRSDSSSRKARPPQMPWVDSPRPSTTAFRAGAERRQTLKGQVTNSSETPWSQALCQASFRKVPTKRRIFPELVDKMLKHRAWWAAHTKRKTNGGTTCDGISQAPRLRGSPGIYQRRETT